MGESAAFILSTGASLPNAVQPMWYDVGGLPLLAFRHPARNLAPPKRGFFMPVLRAARNQQRGSAWGVVGLLPLQNAGKPGYSQYRPLPPSLAPCRCP